MSSSQRRIWAELGRQAMPFHPQGRHVRARTGSFVVTGWWGNRPAAREYVQQYHRVRQQHGAEKQLGGRWAPENARKMLAYMLIAWRPVSSSGSFAARRRLASAGRAHHLRLLSGSFRQEGPCSSVRSARPARLASSGRRSSASSAASFGGSGAAARDNDLASTGISPTGVTTRSPPDQSPLATTILGSSCGVDLTRSRLLWCCQAYQVTLSRRSDRVCMRRSAPPQTWRSFRPGSWILTKLPGQSLHNILVWKLAFY